MSDVPELRQELDRKVMETVEKLACDHEQGKITEAQFDYGISILWTAVAGLVDKDFVNIMTTLSEMTVRDRSFRTRRVFRKENGDLGIIANNHDGSFKTTFYKAGNKSPVKEKVYNFKDQHIPTKRAVEAISELELKLNSIGFEEI